MILDGSNNSSTKSKSHLETHELLDRFELLYDNIDELKDLRRAILDEDLSSIFRLAGKITGSQDIFDEFRKAVLEKNVHSIFRVLESIETNSNFELLRKSIINKGESLVGHEFHRWKLDSNQKEYRQESHDFDSFDLINPPWEISGWKKERHKEGFSNQYLHTSWVHLHWGSQPQIITKFRSRILSIQSNQAP